VEPFRTTVCCCDVPRASGKRLVGLQWGDFDWTKRHVLIQRGVVNWALGEVKTRKSNRAIPLAPDLAALLWSFKEEKAKAAGNADWVFSQFAYWQAVVAGTLQRDHLVSKPESGRGGRIGWHTFRHSYSTLLGTLHLT